MEIYNRICSEIATRHQRARKTLREQPGLATHWYRAGLRDALKIVDAHTETMKEELRRAYRAGRNHRKYISTI